MLRQAADVDLHRVRLADAPDALGGEDVHHPRREPAVRDDGDTAPLRLRVQLALLEHDLGVAAQIGAVDAQLHRRSRDVQVEVVRRRVQDGVLPPQRRAQVRAILQVELAEREALAAGRLQQPGDAVRFQVGHGHLLDAGLLQQIVGTGGPLEPSAQNQHAHRAIASERA